MEPLDFSFTDIITPSFDPFAPPPPPEFKADIDFTVPPAAAMFAQHSMFDMLNDSTASDSSPSSPSRVSLNNSPSSIDLGSPSHFEPDWSFDYTPAPVEHSSLSFTAPLPPPSQTFNLMRASKDSTPASSVKRVYVKKERASPVVEEKKEPKKRARKTSSFSSADSVKSDDSDESLSKRDRNKLSAAKYRKRRKMYVDTLEGQLASLEKKVSNQTETITSLQSENKVMKEQLTFFKNLLAGKIPSTNNPNTSQKAGALMFVLFSCLLLSGSVLHKQQPLPAMDDPAIADFHGPNRMLLSVEEAAAAAPAAVAEISQNTSTGAANDIPALECVPATSIADALGLVHFTKEEISECAAALLEGKSLPVLIPVEEKSNLAVAAVNVENKSVSPMEVDLKTNVTFPSSSEPASLSSTVAAQLFTATESRAV